MSHEIQLSNTNLPLQPALTPPQVLATTGQTDPAPLRRIHGLLRGRYALAAILAAIGAAAGAAAGIMLPKPAYESVGVIQIRPLIPMTGPGDMVMPLYQQYVQDVMVKLHTDRVIRAAMQNPQWKAHRDYPGAIPPAEQVLQFAKNLQVRQMPAAAEMIQVVYTDSQPDAKDVTQIAVSSVINSYREIWDNEESSKDLDQKAKWVTEQKEYKVAQMEANRRTIDSLLREVGDDTQAILMVRQTKLLNLQDQYGEASNRFAKVQEDLKRHNEGRAASTTYDPDQIANVDPRMAYLLNALAEAKILIQTKGGTMLPQNPAMQSMMKEIELRQAAVNEYAAKFNQEWFIEIRNDGSGISYKVPKDLTALEATVKVLKHDIEEQTKFINGVTQRQSQIIAKKQENDRLQAEVNEFDRNLTTYQFQKAMGGQFKLIDEGSAAQPAGDRRPVFAALGFVGGAAVPIGFLLLLGLANPRYRYSDETNTETIGLNLLGILPDLPDRLSDPEQASIAAHCVHQIRTMLQISGGTEERRVFAVTSAAPGDGKTSLTLALGLSYAACGTRTLLIDCDLVGAGLTSRMNVNAPEGVLEAIANRSLMEYVRNTDVADVSILPVGSAQTLHASTLSPAALRRLIDEARKQFDTILIDTGPILGSIEASLVCAAADAVVLTVARGQQRPLVEKSISHLMNIGAKLAGVVFNRAQSNDFDRSISGVSSLRSVASGNGHNGHDGPRYGTLGRAVRSATHDANEG
jgi:capsular exopolysaccharide synthesis family protein